MDGMVYDEIAEGAVTSVPRTCPNRHTSRTAPPGASHTRRDLTARVERTNGMASPIVPQGIPLGLCQCGCGLPTRIASSTDRSHGYVKGQPLRYIFGHTAFHDDLCQIGQRFGRWTVIGERFRDPTGHVRRRCQCDCGTIREICIESLQRGTSKSCRCATRSRRGLSGTLEYRIWCGMRARCLNPESANFHLWGGRGITVCPEWVNDFPRFLVDMGPMPSSEHSIDRIDNDGPYSPDNCRWATQIEQANNRRGNHLLEFRGRSQTMAQWARELGLSRAVIQARLKYGWSVERVLTQKVRGPATAKPCAACGRAFTAPSPKQRFCCSMCYGASMAGQPKPKRGGSK